jgi:hypothetical protein
MRTTPIFLALAVLAAAFAAASAHAGRSLDEPAGIEKVVKAATRADLEQALLATGDRCNRDALKAGDLLGVECRSVVAAALVARRPPTDVAARAALFHDLAGSAKGVSSWEPLSPPPGLGRARFDAHRAISRALMSVYDDVAARADKAPAVAAFLGGSPSPKQTACEAVQRTVDLATGADASPEERGASQSLLTSHACFLDESRLRAEPKPGGALRDNKDAVATAVSAATAADSAIQQYAASRSLDLERCHKHLDAAGKPKDAQKMEQCACGAIGRWKLPSRPAATKTALVVAPRVRVELDVAPGGAVTRCGPLSVDP